MLTLTVILLSSAIISFIVFRATYLPQAKYHNGMLFAVVLPAHAVEDPKIRSVQARFRKDFRNVSLWMAGSLLPLFLLQAWIGYQVIYFLVWLCVHVTVMVMPFRRAFRDTLTLKKEHDWFVGSKRVVQSDLRAAHSKNQRSASLWLFAIPFGMAAGLTVWGELADIRLGGVASGSFVVTGILLLVSIQLRRTKAKVYSTDSDVNVKLNQANRRALSYLWLNVAIVETVHCLVIGLLLANEHMRGTGLWAAIPVLFSGIPVWMILHTYRGIRIREQVAASLDGKVVYMEEDEYWANGFTYHNPQDTSIVVQKRIGMGLTVNTGTLAGKIIVGCTVGVTAAAILGVSFLLVRSELMPPTLTVTPDDRIEIHYPMYSFDFPIRDIQEMKLVEQVPAGAKTNGEATGKVMRGHFRLKELGKSRLYVFKDQPPYIQIKLEDVYIFYNEKHPLLTRQVYEQVRKQVEG